MIFDIGKDDKQKKDSLSKDIESTHDDIRAAILTISKVGYPVKSGNNFDELVRKKAEMRLSKSHEQKIHVSQTTHSGSFSQQVCEIAEGLQDVTVCESDTNVTLPPSSSSSKSKSEQSKAM